MRKIKVMIASLLGAIALIFVCVVGTRVNAADTVSFYDSSVESETVGKEYASNTTIKTDDYLKLETIATKALIKDHVSNDGDKVWTISGKALLYNANTTSSKYFKFSNLSTTNSIDVSVTISACDSKGNLKEAAVTFGTNTSVTTSMTQVVTVSTTIYASSDVVLWTNSTRCLIYTISYTVNEASNDNVATFALGTGVTGNAPEEIKVSKDATDKTITLPTTTATKTSFEFVGWDNGDTNDTNNPYAAGTSYTLDSNTTFTAVWRADVLNFPVNYTYTFTSLDSTSYIAIEGGQIHDKGIKTTADLVISFKLENTTTITLTFDDSNLGSSNKIKIDDASYAVPTTKLTLVLGSGLHTIKRDNKEFRLASISSKISESITATLYKQFDDDDAPTMVRLMGKIEGIAYADYANISNVLMEFEFNGSSKSAYCYGLYKSIATLDNSLGASSDGKTMYVVLTITGLEKYDSKSFTNVKMTITFSDGSTKEATHASF